MSTSETRGAVLKRRAWIAVPVLVFMLVGPFYRHVLGGTNPWLHAWAMYHTSFSSICSVRFVHRLADGSERELDRFASTGYPEVATRRHELFRIRNRAQAVQTARRLCREVSPPHDVRIYAQCGDMGEGWVDVATGEKNVCPVAEQPR